MIIKVVEMSAALHFEIKGINSDANKSKENLFGNLFNDVLGVCSSTDRIHKKTL